MADVRSREEMEEAINNGGSVLYGGKIITNFEDLPSGADLAKASGDESAAETEKARLAAEVKRLHAELAKLQKSEPTPATTPDSTGQDAVKGEKTKP